MMEVNESAIAKCYLRTFAIINQIALEYEGIKRKHPVLEILLFILWS